MGKDKGAESEKSEIEEGELEKAPEEVIGAESEADDAGGDAGENVGDGKNEDEADLEKKSKDTKNMKKKKKVDRSVVNKVKEAEIVAERDAPKGSPRRKVVKEEPREAEDKNGPEVEDSKADERKRDGKWKKSDAREMEVLLKAVAQRRSLDEQENAKIDTEDEEDEDEVEKADDVEDEEKSEEEERKEKEKDLALTMSSSWAPLSERERESLKVTKSGREERDREIETFREVQSESFKERGRAREDDGDLTKDKSRQKKQKLSEAPLLSLSLPDTSLQLAPLDSGHATKSKSKSSGPVPKTSENEKSLRSFGPTQSQSNGYTNSLSLSLSHPFFHNASCSLTQNSFDDKEGTTGSSRQLSVLKDDPMEGSRGSSFGGRDQIFRNFSEGSNDRAKHRHELPLYQRLVQSGHSQIVQGVVGNGEGTRDSSRSFMDERPTESLGNHARGNEGSHVGHNQGTDQHRWKDEGSLSMERSRTSHDRHWSIHKDLRDRHRQEGWSSPSRSASFQDRRFDQHKILVRDSRPDADAGRELSLSGGRVFLDNEESTPPDIGVIVVEKDSIGLKNPRKIERSWLYEIVTEPIPVMAQKLHDVSDNFLENLKRCLKENLESTKRKDEFVSLQRTLQRRADLTTDVLSQSHRTQLEILVALKTGIPAFLHADVALTTPALIEIFLGTKCRNVACQSQLPADDCECKVCSSKGGFCNACMCVVCSKFDFDANTCRWIGCDFCLHWCHSDCGILKGYISSGISTRGSGDSVKQFRCIGCGHTSELYGFVKDVFTTCAKDWPMDILMRELHCVRRIFDRSEDLRGNQLFGRAEQLIVKLNTSRDVEAVCQSMMRFFAAAEKDGPAARASSGSDVVREVLPLPREREMTSRLADAVRDAIHVIKAPNGDGTDLEKARSALQYYDHQVEEKRQEASELHHERAWQKSQIEELENIVQMKLSEAKELQSRADEARREAEGLQRIVLAKTEKIEEEYKLKMVRLQITDVEDRRRKWFDEVQIMEKNQREHDAMKMSMVSDIHELLKKMEATKA